MDMIPDQKAWSINTHETEQQFQAESMRMISQLFPRLRGFVWHTLNEEVIHLTKMPGETPESFKRRKAQIGAMQGNRNKAAGVLAGVMDILCVKFGVLYKVELKLPGGKLSPAQELLHYKWNTDCNLTPIKVCYNLWEVYIAFKEISESTLVVAPKNHLI